MNHLNIIGYLALLAGMILALTYTDLERRNRAEQVEAARLQRIEQLNLINKAQCEEIETLKKQFRQDAREDYDRLDETLELLGLRRTPEIEARALENRNTVLQRFKAGTCPRITIE